MDLILANSAGEEESVLDYDFDIAIGEENSFQIRLSYGTWDERIQIGKLVYIPDTEYGGIIKRINSATNTEEITLEGYTWRGYLAHRLIAPPSGQDYYIANGDLNDIIRDIVAIPGFRVADHVSGANVSNYKFDRYVDVASGLEAMCESVGYRLDIQYKQTGFSGYVLVQAVEAGNYGDDIEYSQDSMIDFSSTDDQMSVNHLICLGIGQLKDRLVVHLYADQYGNISDTQTLTGINEIVEKFDNSGAETQTLIDTGTRRLKELQGGKSFTPSIKDIGKELFIGDVISGKDFITGNAVTEPITAKIVKRENGWFTYEYKISEPEYQTVNSIPGTGGKTIYDMIYPVGSIYMSVNFVSPATLFGGTWERLQDRFLLAAGSTYNAGDMGGSADAVLVSHGHVVTSPLGHTLAVNYGSGDSNYVRATFGFTPSAVNTGGLYGSSNSDQDRFWANAVGEDGTGKNMPPYLAVYMWKRTA